MSTTSTTDLTPRIPYDGVTEFTCPQTAAADKAAAAGNEKIVRTEAAVPAETAAEVEPAKKPAAGDKTRGGLFVSGVMVLTISNLVTKVIGLLFKIPITNIIGDEGMGYFNLTYAIYVWFYMISTAGLPVAVSMMISESRAQGNFREVKQISKITMRVFCCVGAAGMIVMMAGCHLFAAMQDTPPIYLSILTIAPTLLFVCVSSAFRGYFQGYQYMTPTAVSEILEALGKLSFGIVFALYAMKKRYPLPVVAAFAVSGLTIGAFAGMLYLIVRKAVFRSGQYDASYLRSDSYTMEARTNRQLLKTLIAIAIPITVSASVMSLTNLIDSGIVVRCLKHIGFAENQAVEIYGNYSTLAVSMFNLPPVLIYPISAAIIPLLSSILAGGDREKAMKVMKSSVKLVAIIITPCAFGMSALSGPILSMFYHGDSAAQAAPLLSVLAPSCFFLGMLSITNAILQSSGNERKPIISMVAGAAVKLISSATLISIPKIGIYGAPIGTFLCYLTITVMNFAFLNKYVGIKPKILLTMVKPALCSLLCAGSAYGIWHVISPHISPRIATLAAILAAAVIYVIASFAVRAVSRDDLELLPKSKKIIAVLDRFGLLK